MIEFRFYLAGLDIGLGLCGYASLLFSPSLLVEDRVTKFLVTVISSSLFLSGVLLWTL